MNDLISPYDIPKSEMRRGRQLQTRAIAAPVVFTLVPAIFFTLLVVIFGTAPPAAVTLIFFGFIATLIGFLIGLIISGTLLFQRSKWTKEIRERMAADGIKANEIDWFVHELRSHEKRALKDIEKRDLLLGDSYRETLASRLTASRIIRSSGREVTLMERRQRKLRTLNAARSREFASEIEADVGKLRSINEEAKQMLAEAEARLQMIEAASLRGGSIVDNELALKRLNAATSQLPLALEEAKLTEDIRRELEAEDGERGREKEIV
jgi:uncharacterized membrane protein YgaE (UPF0421/DUF939 family)